MGQGEAHGLKLSLVNYWLVMDSEGEAIVSRGEPIEKPSR